MKKYLKYLALFMVLLPLMANGHEIIQLPSLQRDTTDVDTIMPTRDVELVEDGVIVTYHFNAATLVSDPLYTNCKFWRINGFGTNDAATEPAFPLRVDNFKLPRNASGCQIILLDSTYVDISMKIAPARPPLSDNDTIGYNLSNVPPISTYSGRFPSSSTNNYNTYSYRGVPVVEVCVTPMQYDMANEQVRAFTMLKYKVKYDYSGASQVPAVVPVMSKLSPSDHFLENVTLNAEPIELEGDTAVVDNMDYLIISVNKYEQAVNRFANWKRTLGYRTHVVMRDTWTPAEVFSQVKQLYNQEGVNLYYLLIVGDHEDVPALQRYYPKDNENYQFVTDLFYGCVELSDVTNLINGCPYSASSNHIPCVYRGRIPVYDLAHLNNVIDKIISYELTPTTDSLFYKKGLNCGCFEDIKSPDGMEDKAFVKTCEEIRDHLQNLQYDIQRIYCRTEHDIPPQRWSSVYSSGDSLPDDLRYGNFAWSGDTWNIQNGINRGAFYILHRGHGWGDASGWYEPYFSRNTVPSLNNDNQYPIVFSINCYSGKFNGTTCLNEKLLSAKNRGGVATFGATEASLSGFNDAFSIGLFDAIWPGIRTELKGLEYQTGIQQPTYQLGEILEQGLGCMQQYSPNDIYKRYTREIFHLFGDPSMSVYTQAPRTIRNVNIQRGNNVIVVQANDTIEHISLYNPLTNEVFSFKGSSMSFLTNCPADWTICLSAHNRIPYIDYGDVYIQNETINGVVEYNGDNIFVGEKVTDKKNYGEVDFNGGCARLNANQVKLMPGTNIHKGANVIINTKIKQQ